MRWLTALVTIIVLTLAAPAATLADTTVPDTPGTARQITALPYSEFVDLSQATDSDGDGLAACEAGARNRIWFAYTPATDEALRVHAQSNPGVELALWTNPTTPSLAGCAVDGADLIVHLDAGTPYLVSVAMWTFAYPWAGTVLFEVFTPPANDDIADAVEITQLPFFTTSNGVGASAEPNEPQHCGSIDTRWYRHTATSDAALVPAVGWSGALGIYAGPSPDSLSFVGCRYQWPVAGFIPESGMTYWFQLSGGASIDFGLDLAGPPVASLSWWPQDPSTFDDVSFSFQGHDPAGVGFESFDWTFGDGSTGSGWSVTHRYAADGTYDVAVTATTFDGRTATATQTVAVDTHDVAVTKLAVPKSASAGQTRDITVSILNRRDAELVRIELYRATTSGFYEPIGSQVLLVPAHGGGRTTNVQFTYTFTPADAAIGKATFKTIATIEGSRDALPADNELIATTKVMR